jgi:uncharacterized cupin superfamily protein
MADLRLPALDPAGIAPRTATSYPKPFDEVVKGRSKRPLTQALGLTQFGVNITELAPGAATGHRHWHTHEDEFVYVLEGELILVTSEGEQVLSAGMCAGYPAGKPDGHHLVNRSDRRALILEVGTRDDRDEAHYPDLDFRCAPDRYRKPVFTRRDGSPL